MWTSLISKFVSLPKWVQYLGYAAGIALVLGLSYGATRLWFSHHDKQQQEIGASSQREGDLRETLNRTEKGNEARTQVQHDLQSGGRSDALYAQCLRTARTPENCQRFLPQRKADQRGTGTGSGR